MRKNWLFLILAMLIVTVNFDASAQQMNKEKYRDKANDPVSKLPYYKKLRWADNLFKEGSYFNAIEYYTQLKDEQPRNPYLTYQLAECCMMTRDYVPAAHYYGEVYAMASKLYPEAIYKQALMLKMSGDYDNAIKGFEKFIADNPKTYKTLKKKAQKQIDGANMAMNSIKNPEPVNVKNAGPNVNSAYTESAPFPLGDTALLFATMRQNKPVEQDKRARESYVQRFMVSRKQQFVEDVDSFQWPMPFTDGDFNSNKLHVGSGSFSPGGERFYFTKCEDDDSNRTICKIYVSVFDKEQWGAPQLLGEGINESGSNTNPCVAKVGKKEVLFFASNRVLQSRGGFDIWYSIIDPRNNTYRRPQNAGKQINTPDNEITPFYDSREGKLYFSSDGHPGFGGADIFSADGGPSRYTNIKNLGYPINSSADEMYFIKDPLGKPDAYVVSNRVGAIALKNPTCCDDIWRIQYEPRLIVLGKAIHRQSQSAMTDVVVKMVDQNGDMKTFNSADGEFMFNLSRGKAYVFTGDKSGYASTRATVNTMDVRRTDKDDTIQVTIYLDEITPVYTFQVSNIFYDYDKSDLRPESVSSLDSVANFMKDNPSLNVEIYSFADAKGTDKYNKELSMKRAQSVVDYLTTAGIEAGRMVAKGFGESLPVAPNDVKGRDNPAGRQLNRRTELRITTDVPTRRILYNSAKPGNMNEQMNNLQVTPDETDEPSDAESDYSRPGSRLNK